MVTKKKAHAPPTFVTPLAAVAVKQLPEGDEWLYEVKFDGYRALIIKDGSHVELQSRNHKDLTSMYPGIAEAAVRLRADQAVVDGEIVALDDSGRPAFQALQHRSSHPQHHIVFYAFDLLHVDGRDVMSEAIEKRRALLPKLVGKNPVIRVSDDLPGSASQVLEAVRTLGLEGVVAKRRGSAYQPGERSNDWQKLKLENQQEFVVGGFRPDGWSSVDALVVGYFEGKQLKFAGKVRAGLTPHLRGQLRRQLDPLRVEKCPFVDLPSGRSRWGGGITADEMRMFSWTKPQLVAQIRFVEWTTEGRLRHAAYLGVRTDKAAREVRQEP
jgi:bifunctional non-homologous end joining protein LigD